jgi:ubiquinone/menaquinone biosynthesis C-methylase UbiE
MMMFQPQLTRGYGFLEGFLAKQRCRMANSLISPAHRKGSILDIGCGAYPFFLLNTEFSNKYGLDKVMAEISNNLIYGRDVNLINYDVEKENTLPFSDEYFDVVTMLAVFEHIEPERLPQMIGEIHRILKRDGMSIMTTPAEWTDMLLRFMAKLKLVSPVEIEEHKDAYSHAKISALLHEADFSKEKMRLGYFELFMNIWATATK